MTYYLRAIYDDGYTRCGTFANEVTTNANVLRRTEIINEFKEYWNGKKDMHGRKIIGVEVESCIRTYTDGKIERILFNENI